MSSRSGPTAGFSLPTRISSSSSRRTGGGSRSSRPAAGNSAREPVEQVVRRGAEPRPRGRPAPRPSRAGAGSPRSGRRGDARSRGAGRAPRCRRPETPGAAGRPSGVIRAASRRIAVRSVVSEVAADAEAALASIAVALAGRALDVELAHRRRMARARRAAVRRAPSRAGRSGGDVVDRAAEQLQTGRVELVRPRPDPVRAREPRRRGPRPAPRATSG